MTRYPSFTYLLLTAFSGRSWSLTLPRNDMACTTAARSTEQREQPPIVSQEERKRRCRVCPETEREDPEMDRRDAAFAMLGWATVALQTTAAEPANAVYGADAKIELPNPIETMSQRATGQCLVETLGNRECLVYLDPANKLYQGADNQVLLSRIEQASVALATIPDLIAAKKWSQVNGVLTGPLGMLVVTMNQLGKSSGNEGRVAPLAKKVKDDIISIGAAASRKQGEAALRSHKDATDSLVAFVKAL